MSAVSDPKAFGRVAVVMGGASAERDVSLDGGRAVLAALRARQIDAHAVDGALNLMHEIKAVRFDRVFIMLHGRGGEDGVLQGALEMMEVPYTGSGVLGCALTLDKVRVKEIWQTRGLPTPEFVTLEPDESIDSISARSAGLGLPLIVKPVREGSTIGLSRVEQIDDLESAITLARRHDAYVLIERCIEGPEYTTGVLGSDALPLICIKAETPLYDYQAKYHAESTQYLIPSGLDDETERELQAMCMMAFDAAACSGWGRIDFMLDEHQAPWLLEVNTVPGMTGHSLVPMAAKAAGLDFEALVWRILETSMEARV